MQPHLPPLSTRVEAVDLDERLDLGKRKMEQVTLPFEHEEENNV